ncbi:MAG: hypothetical protein ABIO70_03860 [Pseudomonadota bacterium]
MDVRQPMRVQEQRPALRREIRRAPCGLRVEEQKGPDPGLEALERHRAWLVARLAEATAALGEGLVEGACAGPCARGGGLRLLALVPPGCRGCLGLEEARDPPAEGHPVPRAVVLRWRLAGPAP